MVKKPNEKSSQSKWNENPQGRLVLGSVVTDKHGDYQIEQLRIRMSWGFIQLLLRIILFSGKLLFSRARVECLKYDMAKKW